LSHEVWSNKVVRIFPNWKAALRLVTALLMEMDEEWITGRRYVNPEMWSEKHLQPEARAREAG